MPNRFALLLPDFQGSAARGRAMARHDERERFADQELRAQIERQNNLRQLMPQALSAPADQRASLISQIGANDPDAAINLQRHFSTQDRQSEAHRNERLGLMAHRLIEAPAPYKPMMYRSMLNELRELGLNPPPEYSDEVEQLAQAFLPRLGERTQPANVQEWEYYNRLSEDEKRDYLTMKRAAPSFKMGDVTMLGDPVRGTARPFTEEPGQTQADIQRTISQQAAEGVAMQENVKAASKLADESFKRLESVRTNIANYDEAIRLIDEGAQTGVIASRLPSVRQASIALDNLQGRLGLDVIGNTTFGALSEAELRFALSTALPQNMQPQELKVWLQQKRDAQEKLAAYLEQAATFLGTPGNTVKDWIELQRAGQRGTQQPPVTRSAGEPVRVNSPQERDALAPGTQYIAPDGTVRTKR